MQRMCSFRSFSKMRNLSARALSFNSFDCSCTAGPTSTNLERKAFGIREEPIRAFSSLCGNGGAVKKRMKWSSKSSKPSIRWTQTSAPDSAEVSDLRTENLYEDVNPHTLIEKDLSALAEDIRNEINNRLDEDEVKALATYHFDGKGKAIRPLIVLLTARCINHHMGVDDLLKYQRDVAMIAEMIHTASLIHDDVIDDSDVRRGKATLSRLCGQKKAILIGDCVLAITSQLLAAIGDKEVYRIISQILADLVQGEFMQMENPAAMKSADRFSHYLEKTYRKTASLMARPCEAVAVLGRLPPHLQETTYLFGRNLGMAFQLVDDLLDFQCNASELGKPAVADLRSGIATGPVLFAAEKHPELFEMMGRRFNLEGDVDRAYDLTVNGSDGIAQAQTLARSHAQAALRYLHRFKDCSYRRGLELVIEEVLNRRK